MSPILRVGRCVSVTSSPGKIVICCTTVNKILEDGEHFKNYLLIETHHVDFGKDRK